MAGIIDIENVAALRAYLGEHRNLSPAEATGLKVEVLPGGVSCRTVKVSFPSGPAWVMKQALAKLRVPSDWFADPARTHGEALAMGVLAGMCPAGSIPRLVFEDESQNLLAMEAVPDPHDNWKSLLLAGRVDMNHVRRFGALLGAIHSGGCRDEAGMRALFPGISFFQALRLEAYYIYAGKQVTEASTFLGRLVDETKATRLTLVHGDYSPKNVLIHEDRLVLLDHETIHVGDPAFDVGFSLTHLLSKAHHLPAFRERFSDAALLHWSAYREGIASVPWAEDLEPRAVRHTLGCLLARAAGRSQLEYLSAEEKAHQRSAVVRIMAAAPARIADLVGEFLAGVSGRQRGD